MKNDMGNSCLWNAAKETQTKMTHSLHMPEELGELIHVLTYAGGKPDQRFKEWHTAY